MNVKAMVRAVAAAVCLVLLAVGVGGSIGRAETGAGRTAGSSLPSNVEPRTATTPMVFSSQCLTAR